MHNVNRKAGTGTGKCRLDYSLILYYGFTQTDAEVNSLDLDKRLNQGPILLFDIY